MEINGATHPRLGPTPRAIAYRFFCSGMCRPVQRSSSPWLISWGNLGPAAGPGEGIRDLGGAGGRHRSAPADLAHPSAMLPLVCKP